MIRSAVSGTVLAFVLAGVAHAQSAAPAAPATQPPATAAGADAFVAEAEKTLAEKSVGAQQIAWVNATYITDDTDALAAASGAEMTDLAVRYGLGAARYQALPGLSFDTKRKLDLLRGGITLAELVRGLNSLGVGPRDLITILQSIRAAGALQAELEVR